MPVEHDYAACPLCGRNRIIDTRDKGRIRWNYVKDLGSFEFIQIRAGGGKVGGIGGGYRGSAPGIGFKLVGYRTLVEVMDDPVYADVVKGLRDQLVLLVRDAIGLGLIKREELE